VRYWHKYLLCCLLLLGGCSTESDDNVIELDQCKFRLESSENTVWKTLQLPDNWNLSRPGIGGVGNYRFELDLNVAPNRLWALLLPRVSNNAAVYLNGALLGEHGDFKANTLIWNTPFMVTIPSGLLKPGSNEIDIKVSAKENSFGRLLPPLIGAVGAIGPRYEQLYFGQVILSEICAVFSLTMGICMLMLWWYRRDALYGWFALGGISWSVYALYFFVTELPFPMAYWVRFCFSFGFVMLCAMLVFICRFMDWNKRRNEWFVMVYTLFGVVALLLSPDHHLFQAIKWIMAGYAAMFGVLALSLINALRYEQSSRHALVSLAGIGINIGLGLHDWANIFFMLNHPYLLQYGQPLIFLVLGRHLLKGYMSALKEAEATSTELDQRVRVRERELQISMGREKQAEQEKALLKERERIMADIHDGVGGHLISALAIAESSVDGGELVSQTIHQALDELRLVIDSLDPDERKLSQMLAAFRYRYDQRLQQQGIAIQWKFDQLSRLDDVGAEKSLQLLRILQELITNIIKHARADQVSVWMGVSHEEGRHECWLSVADNGVGFDVEASLGRGIGNMRRRAEAVGGRVSFTSQEQGTLAELVFPMAAPNSGEVKG